MQPLEDKIERLLSVPLYTQPPEESEAGLFEIFRRRSWITRASGIPAIGIICSSGQRTTEPQARFETFHSCRLRC